MKEYNLEKLPKGAQQHITVLQSNYQEALRQLAQFEAKEPTPIFRLYGMEQIPIPDSTIRFNLVDRTHIDCRIKGNLLEINASHRVLIKPEASNHFTIEVMK